MPNLHSTHYTRRRLRCGDISVQSRTATGVRVQRVDAGDEIKSVGRLPRPEEEGVEEN